MYKNFIRRFDNHYTLMPIIRYPQHAFYERKIQNEQKEKNYSSGRGKSKEIP